MTQIKRKEFEAEFISRLFRTFYLLDLRLSFPFCAKHPERRSNRVARPCAEEHRYGPSNHSDEGFAQSVGRITEGNSLPAPMNSPHFLGASSRSDLDAGLPRLVIGSHLLSSDRSLTAGAFTGTDSRKLVRLPTTNFLKAYGRRTD